MVSQFTGVSEKKNPYQKSLIRIIIDKDIFKARLQEDPSQPSKKREYETTVNGIKIITRWSEKDKFYGTSRLEIGNCNCAHSISSVGAYENHKRFVEELEERGN